MSLRFNTYIRTCAAGSACARTRRPCPTVHVLSTLIKCMYVYIIDYYCTTIAILWVILATDMLRNNLAVMYMYFSARIINATALRGKSKRDVTKTWSNRVYFAHEYVQLSLYWPLYATTASLERKESTKDKKDEVSRDRCAHKLTLALPVFLPRWVWNSPKVFTVLILAVGAELGVR